jgi:large subunit ribosomal protein L22
MEFTHTQKFIIMSPRKLRPVANMIKKLKPVQAIETLPHIGKRAAEPLERVIKAAVAIAKEKGAQENNLVIKELQINQGPRLKRGRPVSRGRWHPYKKRMSHIRVVLETVEPEVKKGTVEKKETKKTSARAKNKKVETKSKSTRKSKKGGK